MRHERFVDLARKSARKSKFPGYKMACVVAIGGRIHKIGLNKPTSGRAKSKYYKHHHAVHCEFDALRKIPPHLLKKACIYIAGLKEKTGYTLLSKPCESCQKYLNSLKLKGVFYTNQKGECLKWA